MKNNVQLIKPGVVEQWTRWASASTNRKIFSASVVIALCTIGVGVAGIALSTSIVYMVSFCFL